jgi:hypothetical protein
MLAYSFRRPVQHERLAIVEDLGSAIVPVDIDAHPIWPANQNFHRMPDVKKPAVCVRVDPKRARLKRKLFAEQGLAHLRESRTCLLRDCRLRRGRGPERRGCDCDGH